jgi:hypothetical protein
VIPSLGSLGGDEVSAAVVGRLYASDLAFLQDPCRRINSVGTSLAEVECPTCHERFAVDLADGSPV